VLARRGALVRIGEYYEEHQSTLDEVEIGTFDFATGLDTDRRYPQAKIIDMIFFQEGLNNEGVRQGRWQDVAGPSRISPAVLCEIWRLGVMRTNDSGH
jgi:hypothetical protein